MWKVRSHDCRRSKRDTENETRILLAADARIREFAHSSRCDRWVEEYIDAYVHTYWLLCLNLPTSWALAGLCISARFLYWCCCYSSCFCYCIGAKHFVFRAFKQLFSNFCINRWRSQINYISIYKLTRIVFRTCFHAKEALLSIFTHTLSLITIFLAFIFQYFVKLRETKNVWSLHERLSFLPLEKDFSIMQVFLELSPLVRWSFNCKIYTKNRVTSFSSIKC